MCKITFASKPRPKQPTPTDPENKMTSYLADFNTPIFSPAYLAAISPKDRINYELARVQVSLADFLADAMGYNDGRWSYAQLQARGNDFKQRLDFVKAHPLFPEIRVEGRSQGWVPQFWDDLIVMSRNWAAGVKRREEEWVNLMMMALDGAKVE